VACEIFTALRPCARSGFCFLIASTVVQEIASTVVQEIASTVVQEIASTVVQEEED
jgi:hypothetical protein